MQDPSKDNQKKIFLFKLLDNMKTDGVKINADNLAKIAKMGKQTILPYYNQWRFFDNEHIQEENTLPQDLTRALRRLLIDWRKENNKEIIECQNQAETTINQLKEQLERRQEDLQTSITLQQEHKKESLHWQKVIENKNNQLKKNHEDITLLQADLLTEKEKYSHIKAENNQLQIFFNDSLKEQEQRLDKQYQKQIDHWICIVDEERMHKKKLIIDIEQVNKTLLSNKNEQKEYISALKHERKINTDLNKKQVEVKQHNQSLLKYFQLLNNAFSLLETNEKNFIATIKKQITLNLDQKIELKEKQLLLQKQTVQLQEKSQTILQLSKKIDNDNNLKLKLEKNLGYIKGLEKILHQDNK